MPSTENILPCPVSGAAVWWV